MAYKENEKNLNAAICKQLFVLLEKQRKERAQTKKKAVEWAIRVWTSLPAEIQASIISTQPTDLYQFLATKILDAETIKLLSSLSPEFRLDALKKAKVFGKKVSQKK